MKNASIILPCPHRSRRGFAAIMAITLIILVGAAMVMLGNFFALEAARTRLQADQAQLRQLLSAGAAAAIQRADTKTESKTLALPAALTAQNAAVTIEITGDGDDRSAVINAKLGDRRAEQTLKLHRESGRWSVVAADLGSNAQAPASTQPSERSTAASQRS